MNINSSLYLHDFINSLIFTLILNSISNYIAQLLLGSYLAFYQSSEITKKCTIKS